MGKITTLPAIQHALAIHLTLQVEQDEICFSYEVLT